MLKTLKHQRVQRDQRQAIPGFLTIALLLCFVFAARTEAFRYVQVGDSTPPLLVEDVGGTEVKPSLSGKLTVLLFWRPGQSFSLAALRDLAEITQELQGKGVEFLTIADPTAKASDIAAVVKQQGFSLPFFVDRQRRAQEAYGLIVFPSTGIVGTDGRLLFYLPSRNSNYKEIIGGKLKVLLGLMQGKEFEAQLTRLGETFVENRQKARDHYRTGLAFSQAGQKEEAARELAQAINLSPEFLNAHLQLGYLLLETGDTQIALKEFRYVKERNPLSPSARIGIGIAYLRLGKRDKGIQLLEEAVSINPNPVRGYTELGKAYEAKGDMTRALYFYKRAIKKLLQGRK
ncbi:MAG: tetratricopeptide repeat protein [Dehalococcoidia bacterium]